MGQQLQEEGRHHQGRRSFVEGPKRADQHPVTLPVGLTVGRHDVNHLQQRRRVGKPLSIEAKPLETVDRLGLGDDVEIAPPPVKLDGHVAGRLQTPTELRSGLPDSLGHRTDLSVLGGQQDNDAVGLAKAPRP